MKIRTRYTLVSAALIGAVVASITYNVVRVQREMLQKQSEERRDTFMEGVSRLAQEAAASRDELMLISYLMFLQREHSEMAVAFVNWGGRVSCVGEPREGLMFLTRKISGKDVPAASHKNQRSPDAPATLQFTLHGRPLDVAMYPAPAAKARGSSSKDVEVQVGFVTSALQEEIDHALRPLLARTLSIAALFMAIGILAAIYLGRLVTEPLTALAEAAEAVGRGNLDVLVPIDRKDEIGALARNFNDMTVRLKELIRLREDLLHTLTHELNTPLSGIKGYVELMHTGRLPEERRPEALETMMAAVRRMEHSLGNVLVLFQLEHKQEQLTWFKVVWVDRILREAVTLFSPVAQSKRISLTMIKPRTVGYVIAEEEPVRQIATNLISNALKYTPDGGRVQVGIENTPESLDFWVKDTGPGIAPEALPLLFNKFNRAGAGEQAGGAIPGTGLGLSIVKKAVDQLGGSIRVESDKGQGATFYVSLPKKHAQAMEAVS